MLAIKHYLYHVPLNAIKDLAHSAGLTTRSTAWPRERKAWLVDNPTCAACGSRYCIQVHHKEPFHLYPEKELLRSNFITLCEYSPSNHHLHTGHNGNWKDFNPNVVQDAAKQLKAIHV